VHSPRHRLRAEFPTFEPERRIEHASASSFVGATHSAYFGVLYNLRASARWSSLAVPGQEIFKHTG